MPQRVARHRSALADLDAPTAQSLGLPAAPPFALRLVPQGLITDPDFRVEARFVGPGDRPLRPAPVREGAALLRHGEALYRLPRPLPDLLDAAAALAACPGDQAERMAALARLKALIPDAAERWVAAEGYLRTIRVIVPAAFSLRLSTRGGRFDVDPVLFGREAQAEVAAGLPIDEAQGLLAPVEDEAFRRRFREEAEVRAAYPLARGSYVFLEPAVAAALAVVREVQRGDAAAREAFARQPQRILAERLGDRLDPAAIEALFVETEQYSERVAGLGLWQPPVLPWLVRQANGWLPERFGLRVGDRTVEIPVDRLGEVEAAIEGACARGAPVAEIAGIGTIPASAAAQAAIRELGRQLRPPELRAADDDTAETAALPPGGKLVLLVKDNLEDVGFTRAPTPRRSRAADGPPAVLATPLKQHCSVETVTRRRRVGRGCG